MTMGTRFSEQAEAVLREAGWYPGRQVPDLVALWKETLLQSDGFEMFPSAEKALLEFGGLKIDQQGPGVSCSREPFEINPTMAKYENDRFEELASVVDSRLYPLGEAVCGLCYLAIAENDSVYLLMNDLRLVGKNIDEGLEALLIGLQPSAPITRV